MTTEHDAIIRDLQTSVDRLREELEQTRRKLEEVMKERETDEQ